MTSSSPPNRRILMKGNEAFAEGAIRAGCDAYFGYPITPQTELLEYMARRMPELGRAFVQAESEVAAINMVIGAGGTGARVMTSLLQPGHQPQAGRDLLPGGDRAARGHRERDARRPGARQRGSRPGRLLPGDQGRRPRRLPSNRPCSSLRPGGDGPDQSWPSTWPIATGPRSLSWRTGWSGRRWSRWSCESTKGPATCPAKDWAVGDSSGRRKRILLSIGLEPEVLEASNRQLLAKYRRNPGARDCDGPGTI